MENSKEGMPQPKESGEQAPEARESKFDVEEIATSLEGIGTRMREHEDNYVAQNLVAPENTARLLRDGDIEKASDYLEDYVIGLAYLAKDIERRKEDLEKLRKVWSIIAQEKDNRRREKK